VNPRAQRCLPRILIWLLPGLAAIALSSAGAAGQDKPPGTEPGKKTEAPSKKAQEPASQDPAKAPQGTGPQSGAGKALNRFLQGKKGAKSTQEPKAGKEKTPAKVPGTKPEKAATKTPGKTPGNRPDGTPAGETGNEKTSRPDKAKTAGGQAPSGQSEQQKATEQGLQKFLQGKGKTGPGTVPPVEGPPGGEKTSRHPTAKPASAAGPQRAVIRGERDERLLLPAPIHLTRGLRADAPMPLTGNLSAWYRSRRSGDDTDQQLIGLLAVDYGDAEQDVWSAHFLGRGAWDLDGNSSSNTFNGILQTYPDAVTGRIYTLYLQRRHLGPFAVMRLGRQEIRETPEPAWFDGVSVETEAVGRMNLRAGGYIGRATRIYAASEDALSTGLDVELEPWYQGRIRADWMYLDQRQPVPAIDDQLFGLTWWQSFGQDNQFFSRITSIGDRGRDLILRDTHLFDDWGLQAEISYIELLTTQRRQVVDFDLFTEAAFEYKPYRQFQIHLDQEVTDHLSVDGGLDVRRLKHSSDEGRFNREYERYFLSGSLHDLFRETTAFSVTWNRFDSGGEDFDELSADCVCRFLPGWEARVGSTYSLFKYDWTTSQEREHVRTYDVGLTWKPNPSLRLRILYILEDDDIGRFHSLRAAFSWDF